MKLPKATGKRDNRDGSPEKENKAKRQKKAIEKAPRIGEHLQAELEGRPRADTRKLKVCVAGLCAWQIRGVNGHSVRSLSDLIADWQRSVGV